MSVLSSGLRSVLERAVGEGRVAAEVGARSALARLGVADAVAPSFLSAEEVGLREGLLARAMQLGDPRSGASVEDAVPLLVGEVAYEQWHRLLFARFLAVNNLLMHPEYGAPVSLRDCEDLAGSIGEPDGWAVAARFASQILPGIFRLDDPAVLVPLAPEDRLALEKIVTGLPEEVFTADDALGWVYQYWQSKQKKQVNDSGRKIGGADISPVTQLFTEDYMVRFLLENSLGAWWAARHPHSPLIAEWEYLRFDDEGTPAAGSFDGWPNTVDQVTVMDPCCGSGHFLVAAFGMMWRMRAEAEGRAPADAQDAVLRDNLFGLELDPRCTQIAMFNLALEAWKQGGYRELPVPNVACSGIPAKAPLHEWTVLADGDVKLETALTRLHELFKDADTLGSLIDPRRAAEQDDLFTVDWDTVAPLLERALANETHTDPAAAVFGHAAAGIAHAADLLSRTYTLIATNVPYLGITRYSSLLREYLFEQHFIGRHDLGYAMVNRWGPLADESRASCAVVSPAEWMTGPSISALRRKWLESLGITLLARLGYSAFQTGLRANPSLLVAGSRRNSTLHYIDVIGATSFAEVSNSVRHTTAAVMSVDEQLRHPGHIISAAEYAGLQTIGEVASCTFGLGVGDFNRFERAFWELPEFGDDWEFLQTSPTASEPYGGRELVILWERESGSLARLAESVRHLNHKAQQWRSGKPVWGKVGVVLSRMGGIKFSLYTGERFSERVMALVPHDPTLVPALWAFASSGELEVGIRQATKNLSVSPRSVKYVPFDVEHWRKVAAEQYPDGLPEPHSDDPTQWLFKGVVAGSTEPLQVAVARLLGFSWPDQEPDALDGLADKDGIVCLPPIAGEASAAERLRALLSTAYGEDWSTAKLDELLTAAGGKPGDLDGWLRDGFFKHHTKVFQNRPFIWHVWDGRADGFSALVNYHRLDRKTLEKLTYTTLGWWIQKQKDDATNELPGAAARLAAAEQLKAKLELILEGEPPYDIYVRWKSLAEQPIGWDPDLDDGVRMNIRPLVEAGILRNKFTINWNKDRGANPDGTQRHNDLHHTNTQKRQARGEDA
ncbi:BREX-1 system adenine-specific DNA-methyltransferase PglX [Agromyces sp. C10]|uniref:BREX-1 system adenine-specific DNA-methyltransferase PglX n=1 Tax=Agromyces sp. C10 TaxID=2935077 RepID=UPI00200ADC8F|nr:BREX-1 system adenine-specific DNA-methyltransferase PglX [Agromyces sp. C10]MCK8609317.1 BREX-1 system adenine-specific DNA-methyltransferase PglX [Agromyces sp. C10]